MRKRNEQRVDEMEKAERVVDFYVFCNKLKDEIRTGWKVWNVKRERVESIAEHIFGVQMLAISMWSEYNYDIDLPKTLSMLAVHELEEIIIGDITIFDAESKSKQEKGHQAVEQLTSILSKGVSIKDLVFEFDKKETKEAKFAYFCDKLECDIQSKLYDQEGCVNLNNQKDNEYTNNPEVKKAIDNEKTWSDAWIKFGQKRYNYDENFLEVSNYVLNNNISNNKEK